MKRKGAKRGHSRSKVEAVYVTIRHHPVDKKRRDVQKTVTIPEVTYEQAASAIWPVVAELKATGEGRLERMDK